MTNGFLLPKMGFSWGTKQDFLDWDLGELFRMSRDCDKEQFTFCYFILFYAMFQKSQSATKNKTRLKEYVNI